MSDAPPPILAYASRVEMVPLDAPREMSLEFNRPSARAEMVTRCFGLLASVMGIVLVAVLAIVKTARGDRWDQGAVLNNLAGVLVMVLLGWWCMHGIRRLWRYGDTFISIELADGRIVIDDPVQFGRKPKVLSLSKLRGCSWSRDALISIPPVSICRIQFLDRRFEQGFEVRVLARNRLIVERAVADLKAAIKFHRGLA